MKSLLSHTVKHLSQDRLIGGGHGPYELSGSAFTVTKITFTSLPICVKCERVPNKILLRQGFVELYDAQ